MDSDLDRKDRSSKLMDFVLEVIYINMWRTLASVTKSLKKRKKKTCDGRTLIYRERIFVDIYFYIFIVINTLK